ncbi:MAG: MFS transporter [Planctomycetaceae bacterium]|nr:MFS transporter [Planctomycetales bacterium]MCB9873360.1 MFS transporter [Planctomycetaceae bacterium]MCB9941174.1 MFS transporter [Planctomycetaceae bacterium]
MWDQPTSQRAIVIAGCLGMAYTQLTMSPATIEFARANGADGLHIGILGALPTATIFMQFVAAVLVNHLQYRRTVWFTVSIIQRLVYLPIALGPWLVKEVPGITWVWALIAATAMNHALLHFCTPLWMSWMGDYLPREGLNRFWGRRHQWMQWTAALSLLAASLLMLQGGWPITSAFAVLIGLGAVLGVADILLFKKVNEPRVQPLPQPTLRRVFSAPFNDKRFRSFISYACFWHFAAMVGAPFISLYLLEYVGLSLGWVLMMWAGSWVGGALLSRSLGGVIEQFGHRPVLILCTAFKTTNMIALLLVPPRPDLALAVLTPVFMIDALLNAGIAIASNGFLLKNSPQENRTMFIAAGTALAGMVGGITAVAAGAWLRGMSGWTITVAGGTYVGFHVLFVASLILRFVSIGLAIRVHEPNAHSTRHVARQLIGATPLRILSFPVGLYRNRKEVDEPTEADTSREPRAKVEAA